MSRSDTVSDSHLSLAVALAATDPLSADLNALYHAIDHYLADLPLAERLTEAGRWLARLADLYVARADLFLNTWQNTYHPTEPFLSPEVVGRWVVQSQFLHLDDWLSEPDPHYYPEDRQSPCTQVEEVEKSALLNWIDDYEEGADLPDMLTIPEDEDPTTWMLTLREFWQRHPNQNVSWHDLCSATGLPPAATFLALLLAGYPHHRKEDSKFYDPNGIWVLRIAGGGETEANPPGDNRRPEG
jgi:hypothetical protein